MVTRMLLPSACVVVLCVALSTDVLLVDVFSDQSFEFVTIMLHLRFGPCVVAFDFYLSSCPQTSCLLRCLLLQFVATAAHRAPTAQTPSCHLVTTDPTSTQQTSMFVRLHACTFLCLFLFVFCLVVVESVVAP